MGQLFVPARNSAMNSFLVTSRNIFQVFTRNSFRDYSRIFLSTFRNLPELFPTDSLKISSRRLPQKILTKSLQEFFLGIPTRFPSKNFFGYFKHFFRVSYRIHPRVSFRFPPGNPSRALPKISSVISHKNLSRIASGKSSGNPSESGGIFGEITEGC